MPTKREWKSGPKPKPAEEVRSKRVTIRMTSEEYERVMGGKPAGVSASTWLYHRAMGQELPRAIPELNRDAWAHLGKTAGGLTAMAQAAGQGRVLDIDSNQFGQYVAELREALDEVRRLLIGQAQERPE